jgi:glycosyltransferase involved in cell wall biosynthesis
MRIAQIAPLHEAVPPKLYGGTERVVSFLTEELVAQGHEVTLFASGDSVTSARLEAIWPPRCGSTRRSAIRSRHPKCLASRHAPENRRESGSRRPRIL